MPRLQKRHDAAQPAGAATRIVAGERTLWRPWLTNGCRPTAAERDVVLPVVVLGVVVMQPAVVVGVVPNTSGLAAAERDAVMPVLRLAGMDGGDDITSHAVN
jgi:hypothetical protein